MFLFQNIFLKPNVLFELFGFEPNSLPRLNKPLYLFATNWWIHMLSFLIASHIPSCEDFISFSQLLQLRRLRQDFHHKAHNILGLFPLCGYPEHILLIIVCHSQSLVTARTIKQQEPNNRPFHLSPTQDYCWKYPVQTPIHTSSLCWFQHLHGCHRGVL